MKRFLTMLILAAMLMSLFAGCAGEADHCADPGPADFKGLVLTAPADTTLNLYTEFKEGVVVAPSQVYETEETDYYYYSGLMGAYSCKVSGKGYYTVTKNIVVTQEKNATKTVMNMDPGKKAGDGWETSELGLYTDELLENGFCSDISLWPDYADVFTTPYFTEEHGVHQMTTQAQLEAFLKGLDDADDDLYLYSAGTSGIYHHDIPLVIFTTEDLSGAATVEAAAAALKNGKPTIFYRAHIHGNEPAAGEAAMAAVKLLDSTWGHYLEQVNICVVPRGSPDGAQNYDRKVMGGVDPNRDNLRIRTPEVESFIWLCNTLEPEVIIDGHEYNANPAASSMSGGDMLVGLGYTNDNSDEFRQLTLQISQIIFSDVVDNGLDCRYYSNYTNTTNSNISRAYASRRGTMFFLLESRGIGCGLSMYPRRIVSHVISLESIFGFVAENPQLVQTTVANEKQMIIDKGAVYDSEDRIVLATDAVEDVTLRHNLNKYDQLTGQPVEGIVTPKVYSLGTRDRIAPTAYVIPAGESFTDNVLKLMDMHGITYTFIPAGSRVRLQQYSSKEADYLTDETTVSFPNGAYVFCKNQSMGLILSMLMEPDIDDLQEHSGTLVQQGIITVQDGMFPIYRYIHDLNSEGFIDCQ